MFKSLKEKFSKYLARRKFLKNKENSLRFNDFFNESNTFLLLMPNVEEDFNASVKVVEYLNRLEKKVTLLVPVKYFSRVTQGKNIKIIQYSVEDINKFNLPSDFLANKLKRTSFDSVIDLERFENLLYSSLSGLATTKFKIGFKKEKLNEFYNILISTKRKSPDYCYQEMINSLKMF